MIDSLYFKLKTQEKRHRFESILEFIMLFIVFSIFGLWLVKELYSFNFMLILQAIFSLPGIVVVCSIVNRFKTLSEIEASNKPKEKFVTQVHNQCPKENSKYQ